MNDKTQRILKIWHDFFNNEEKQYSEFESSDIEYFTGCMLYNYFNFSKALKNLKTMDLSYDFLVSSEDSYDDVKSIIESIDLEDEKEKLSFLQDFIKEAKLKYSGDALYLLNRLESHVDAMAQRYEKDVDIAKVDFENPLTRSR